VEEDDEWVEDMLDLGVWVSSWWADGNWKGARRSQEFGSRYSTCGHALDGLGGVVEVFATIQDTASDPRTPKDRATDILLPRVFDYLSMLTKPTDLDNTALTRFVRYSLKFFVYNGKLWRRTKKTTHQLVILDPTTRRSLLTDAHDKLGHKGFYSTHRVLTDRFWWPGIDHEVAMWCKTCHECQIRSVAHVRLPLTIASPAALFRKAYVDTMHMTKSNGLKYIVQARCSLTAYVEYVALGKENAIGIGKFLFRDLLCRWGGVEEIVTDNGKPFVAAMDWIAKTYGIRHIRISGYNKQANGLVERSHRTLRDSLVKACAGDISRWPTLLPHIVWADRVTTRKSTGYSPFYMAHGIEPVLPFNLAEATYLIPQLNAGIPTSELVALRAQQLLKRPADLALVHDRVLKA
jgi:hypothetical protein